MYETNRFKFAIKSEVAFTFATNFWTRTVRSTNKMAEGLPCSIVGCGYITPTKVPDEAEMQYKVRLMELQMAQFQIHRTDAHNMGGGAGRVDHVPGVKAKMAAPKLQLGVDHQMWDQFMTRWELFKTTMGVDDATAPSWLFTCLDKDLGDEVIKANPGNEPQFTVVASWQIKGVYFEGGNLGNLGFLRSFGVFLYFVLKQAYFSQFSKFGH